MSVEMKAATRFTYRIERVHWEPSGLKEPSALLEHLNQLGRGGWRVVSIDLNPHPSYAERTIPVLLERAEEG